MVQLRKYRQLRVSRDNQHRAHCMFTALKTVLPASVSLPPEYCRLSLYKSTGTQEPFLGLCGIGLHKSIEAVTYLDWRTP